ncbi:MAG: hypothetical protein HOP18_25140 [Deltaproteobacteria bacterium]|nr:hypothetical protein [Deltaproteobacteria bacterium]
MTNEAEHAGRKIDHSQTVTEPKNAGFDTVFPPGTILACSGCGEGLYKVLTRATTADLVMDDGTILQPLNITIPPHDAWKSLACVKCGGRVYKTGKLHTLQTGWT